MRRLYSVSILLLFAVAMTAQHRVVADAKKSINQLSMSVTSYQAAINKIKPALVNDETKSDPEAWYVAGKAYFGLYDKYKDTKMIGKKVDTHAMCNALLAGYDSYLHAMSLDTIREVDGKGKPRIDKNTRQQRVKTRFSGDIVDQISKHAEEFNVAGGELYNIKEWNDAYKAWQVYLDILQDRRISTVAATNEVLGQTRYYQGIALWQKGDNAQAAEHFAMARNSGYTKKEAFDYALVCLSAINDDQGIVALAREAYDLYGTADVQYARILINNYINLKQLDKAARLIDEVIDIEPDDAELQNLKGLVVEQKDGLDKAFLYFKKSVELDEDNASGLFNLGRYYYNEATRVAEANSRMSARALARKVNPLYQQALPYLEKSYKLDPSNDDARNALRTIYYKLGDAKKLDALEGK
ncbi:MAG: hypothetical protein J6S96_08140 [Muribaculaceae bacterium]|nr:hypothetical protein [Muribaculaceae bacterium]